MHSCPWNFDILLRNMKANTLFFYKNNFIRTKALILAKIFKNKLRTSPGFSVRQNMRTKCLGQDMLINWDVYVILVPWFLTDCTENLKMNINPFVPNAPFLYPLKTSENCEVFWCFQGVEKACVGNEWVKQSLKDVRTSTLNKCKYLNPTNNT